MIARLAGAEKVLHPRREPYERNECLVEIKIDRNACKNILVTSKVDRRVISLAMDENSQRIKTFYTKNCEPFEEGTYDIVKAQRLEAFA